MTDISSLPVDDGNCENDEFVNNLLNDLNGNEDQNSDDILNELSDAPEEDYEGYEEYEEETSQQGGGLNPQELLEQFKVPLVIIVVAFLINSEFVEQFILNVPFFTGDSKMNIFGLILKAVLVGVLFFVIDKYIL